jgi:hypothetical protein
MIATRFIATLYKSHGTLMVRDSARLPDVSSPDMIRLSFI